MSYSLSDPIKSHINCSRFVFPVPLMMLFAAVYSVATGVGGCGWPILDRVVPLAVDFWQLSNNPPNSASVADAIAFLIFLNYTCTALFSGGH